MSEDRPPLRLAVLGIVTVALFAALFARLWYLQVVASAEYEVQAQTNRIRFVQYSGPRGEITDRNGIVVVGNRESIVVTIDRNEISEVDDPEALFLRLARALNTFGILTKVTDIEDRLADLRYDPFKPVPIAEDVGEELELYLLERHDDFPSVDVERTEVRTYPHGAVAAHIVGYTGLINRDELEAREGRPKTYQGGDEIGKTGIERIYEDDLRGVPGVLSIEVDASGRDVRVRDNQPPLPGDDVELTIDIALQQRVEQLLAEAIGVARRQEKSDPAEPDYNVPGGAAVVLDIESGDVLAMASYPTFDPEEFVGGIRSDRFDQLNDPTNGFPLTNRAIQSGYAPGSTFKLVTAYAALSAGLVKADDVIIDRGRHKLENCDGRCVFRNAGDAVYGAVDLPSAITWSSDVYFYSLGETFWVEQDRFRGGPNALQQVARAFGVGSPTGVQLPFEEDGLISDPDFKRQRNQDFPEVFPEGRWFTGDSVNLSIGQGDVLLTPLQLANLYGAFANGGAVMAPNVARSVISGVDGSLVRSFGLRVTDRIPQSPTVREPIMDGLLGTVAFEGPPSGTAFNAFSGFPLDEFPIAGKTGTAEVNGKADTALFAAFGPADRPKYAVVAILEEAGFGSRAAAPLVRRIFEQLEPVRSLVPGTTPWEELTEANRAAALRPTVPNDATPVEDGSPDGTPVAPQEDEAGSGVDAEAAETAPPAEAVDGEDPTGGDPGSDGDVDRSAERDAASTSSTTTVTSAPPTTASGSSTTVQPAVADPTTTIDADEQTSDDE